MPAARPGTTSHKFDFRTTRSLARTVATALAAGTCVVHATTTFVSKCTDDGSPGTLRSVLTAATSGETVDAYTHSQCSTITLTQGEIPVPASVTVQGPASGTLTIDAGHNGRVFHSTASTPADSALTMSSDW